MAGSRDRDITDAELEKIKEAQKAAAEKAAADKAAADKAAADKAAADKAAADKAAADKAAAEADANKPKPKDAFEGTITGALGSDLERFRKDPTTGKDRTPEDIIKAAVDAGLKSIKFPEGTSEYQKINSILSQLKSNAERNAPNTSISADVYKLLGGKRSEGSFSQYVDPSAWRYKGQIGQIVQGPDDRGPGKVLDRNQKFLSKEELAYYNERVQNPDSPSEKYGYVDPVTGFQVAVNPFTGEIDWDRTDDLSAFQNANNPNFPSYYDDEAGGTTFDPVTGLPISKGTGTGSGGGSIYAPQNAERKSAYDLLYQQFKQYGLESLVEPLKKLITSNTPPSEFIIELRKSDAYQKRFAGNAERIKKGLAAISEAEYIALEDQYQNIMRNYGLPDKYWAKDAMGTQQGFTNFIGNDVSATELEDRIMNAQNRVVNSNPEVSAALKQFYPEITNADILAYTLDPTKGLEDIKRKITAAEIGGAALQLGLQTSLTRAEELRKYGITKDTAQQGYGAIGSSLMRGSQLASIYGENPYTQTTAESEVFKIPGAEEARKQRQKITGLERATFSGQSGLTSGALQRDRAGGY
jgi:hypothetical protein